MARTALLHTWRTSGFDSGKLAQKLFLWIAVPSALLLCFLISPFEAADEPAHYLRMVAIANGDILPVTSPPGAEQPAAGAYVDVNAANLARTRFGGSSHYSWSELDRDNRLHPTDKVKFAAHSNTAIYPPFLYVASASATALAKAAGLPVLWWLYLGRLANVVVASLITQAALRRSGDAGLFLFGSALVPVTIFQIATVSADALLLPLAIAFVVMLLRIQRHEAHSRREAVALSLTTFLICVGKVAYLPLAILPPLAARLADKRWSLRALFFVAIALLTLLVWVAWANAVQDKIFSIRPNVEIDPKAQLLGLLAHPAAGVVLFVRSMAQLTPRLVIGAVGRWLGWGDLIMPAWLIYPIPFLLAAAAVPAESPSIRRTTLTIATLAAVIMCYCAIFLLIYLQYNEVGAPNVVGVNGRYFTPLAIIILSMTPRLRISKPHSRQIWLCATAVALVSAFTTLISSQQHYW